MAKNNTQETEQRPVNPPEFKKIKRTEEGLIEGLEYRYTEENLIDWRALLPVKYLYIKSDLKSRAKIEKKYGKNYNEIDIVNDKVEDVDLIINLAGLRYIGRLRGISEVREVINISNEFYASATSFITYIPNTESEMRPITFSSSASATLQNTTDFYQRYLVEAASNRAFARNIRAFCNISIVSFDELGKDNQENSSDSQQNDDIPTQKLQEAMDKHHITFEQLKDKMVKEKIEGAENFKSIREIPGPVKFSYVNRLKKLDKE